LGKPTKAIIDAYKGEKHQPLRCDVKACIQEATRWIDTEDLSGDFDIKDPFHTFYLCEHHAAEISPDDDVIRFLNPETGKLRTIELAVYACNDDCEVCSN